MHHSFFSKNQQDFSEYVPPVPEKLYLEVGTPWVDRVYDRKSVPGFFVIWTTQIWHFLESASTQRGALL